MSKQRNHNFRYFLTAQQDRISGFIKSNLKWILIFCAFLICGLVVGIISTLKPTDAFAALEAHNGGIFGVIEEAAYLPYIFSSIFILLFVVVSTSFIGRFAYSSVILILVTLVGGYFQGGTVILVVRVYGFISIPFVIFYAVGSLLVDLILFCHFAKLAKCAADSRKYGCRCTFLKTLFSAVPVLIAMAVVLLFKYIFVITFSFFL